MSFHGSRVALILGIWVIDEVVKRVKQYRAWMQLLVVRLFDTEIFLGTKILWRLLETRLQSLVRTSLSLDEKESMIEIEGWGGNTFLFEYGLVTKLVVG